MKYPDWKKCSDMFQVFWFWCLRLQGLTTGPDYRGPDYRGPDYRGPNYRGGVDELQ